MKKGRTCAHCEATLKTYSLFYFGSDYSIDRRDIRVLCHPCVRHGWKFDEVGLARYDATRAVDGSVRRGVDGLLRGSVGTPKERRV